MPEEAQRLRVLANIAFRSGRGAQAAELLARAAQASPEDARVRNELALVLRELGRLDEAEAECRKALELDAASASAHANLGEVLRRRGRMPEARRRLESALQLAPGIAATRVALGDVLVEQGEIAAAVDHYRAAIGASPKPAAVQVRLGIALRALGDDAGALQANRTAVSLDPAAPECHYHLAQTLLGLGRPAEAIPSAEQAIRLRTEYPAAHTLHGAAVAALGDLEGGLERLRLGQAPGTDRGRCLSLLAEYLLDCGYTERALECLQRKLALDPGDPAARHFIAALTGSNPDRPADEYVRHLFDSFAGSFDERLVGALGYSVPRELANAVLTRSERAPPWDVLDLGCGTGLVGAELAAHARTLTGVDLSPRMIEQARRRGVYTRLACGDLAIALDGEARYDVVTAGDVFIYVGKLDALAPRLRAALRPGGVLAFTAEAAEEAPLAQAPPPAPTGYRLATSGRYVHHGEYLSSLALRSAFEVVLMQRIRLRLEGHRPVLGWLALWRAR